MDLGLPKSVQLHLAAEIQPPFNLTVFGKSLPKTTLDPRSPSAALWSAADDDIIVITRPTFLLLYSIHLNIRHFVSDFFPKCCTVHLYMEMLANPTLAISPHKIINKNSFAIKKIARQSVWHNSLFFSPSPKYARNGSAAGIQLFFK